MDDDQFTLFYAWQSDTDSKSNHYFIRDVLKKALKKLGKENLVEAPRLDHDTQGVPGTPDIANTIFEKIRSASMIVADLTFIDEVAEESEKRIPNPNVLIELGYALSELGWERIICVMNSHFGNAKDLPFDLQNRRWPITYHLSPEAMPEDRAKQKEELSKRLFDAVKIIAKLTPTAQKQDLSERVHMLEQIASASSSLISQLSRIEEKVMSIDTTNNQMVGIEENIGVKSRCELIDRITNNAFENISIEQGLLVITIAPENSLDSLILLQNYEHQIKTQLVPLYSIGWDFHRYGDRFVTYSKLSDKKDSVCEITDKGFINAVGHEVISVNKMYFKTKEIHKDVHFIPSIAYEKNIIEAVQSYLSLYTELEISPPFIVSVGMINLQKSALVVGAGISDYGRISDENEILPPPVKISETVEIETRQGVARLLRPAFDYIWREYNYPCSLNYSESGEWIGR